MKKHTILYDNFLFEQLKDPEFCVHYLNEAAQDNDEELLLLALNNVARAQGGFSVIAKSSKLRRNNLYRMLSKSGNPTLQNFVHLLNALNFQISFRVKSKPLKLKHAA